MQRTNIVGSYNSKGFTLVELAVAMTILLLAAFAAMTIMLASQSRSLTSSAYRKEAERVVKDLLDETVKKDFALVVSTSGNVTRKVGNKAVNFSYTINVAPVTGAAGFAKAVNATVTWKEHDNSYSLRGGTVVVQP